MDRLWGRELIEMWITILSFFAVSVCGVLPILSASLTQPTLGETIIPCLKIAVGSGKTSYVSGVIGDSTDPAATLGINFSVVGASLPFVVTSSDTAVVPLENIRSVSDGSELTVKIEPAKVGYTTIKFTAKSGDGNSDTYTIKYAASELSGRLQNTIFPTHMADASAVVL